MNEFDFIRHTYFKCIVLKSNSCIKSDMKYGVCPTPVLHLFYTYFFKSGDLKK